MKVRDKLIRRLQEQGWTQCDNVFHKNRVFAYDTVSIEVYETHVDFVGRCNPLKEGWEVTKKSFTRMFKELTRK